MLRSQIALVVPWFLLVTFVTGCHSWSATSSDNQDRSRETSEKKIEKPVSDPPLRVIRGAADDQQLATGPGEDGELSAQGAADLAWRVIDEGVEFHPVLAVWIMDASPSAQRLVSQTAARLRFHYENANKFSDSSSEDSRDKPRLQSVVLTYANDQPTFLLEEPSSSTEEVTKALDSTTVIESEEEHTMAAIQVAISKYGGAHTEGKSILFFVISDEAGDDWQRIDELLPAIQESNVAVYAIGSPAPFGRADLGTAMFKLPSTKSASELPMARYGPESRDVEFVRFDAPFRGSDLAVVDSSFGPFGLERLCRASGGVFLAVRPKYVTDYVGVIGDTWPSPYAKRFPRDVMRQYEPDYVSAEDYQRLLETNAAANALHRAASLKPAERMLGPQLEFVKRDEAQFSGDLGKAQQLAARIEPGLTKIYDLLKEGEAARDRLSSKRWQAGYDLAMGQISVSRARVEGYNAMLARAKRGMAFKNPDSKSWMLQPAEEHADSTLEKLASRGREYLERVIREHPNTPWETLAKYELSSPTGWTWIER